jgi:mono/diheme cytochrome c family protein
MRSALEAAVAAGLCLAPLTGGCRSASRATEGAAPRLSPPPPPSSRLSHAIAEGERASLASLPPDSGRQLVQGNCVLCHGVALIQQQHKDSAGWAKTVGQMRAWGAPLPEAQVPGIITYLAKHYGVKGP